MFWSIRSKQILLIHLKFLLQKDICFLITLSAQVKVCYLFMCHPFKNDENDELLKYICIWFNPWVAFQLEYYISKTSRCRSVPTNMTEPKVSNWNGVKQSRFIKKHSFLVSHEWRPRVYHSLESLCSYSKWGLNNAGALELPFIIICSGGGRLIGSEVERTGGGVTCRRP